MDCFWNTITENRVNPLKNVIYPDRYHWLYFDEFAIKDVAHHQKGQGISLAICRYILHYHHGTIHVEGNPGSGATFVIKLPLQTIEGIGEYES